MRQISLFLVLVFLCIVRIPETGAQSAQQALSVSMLQLLTTPEQFDGKTISVVGFLAMDHEGDLLFAHQEDAVHVILGNAVQIEGTKQMLADKEKLNMKYVKILGRFKASDRRRIPFFSGAITELRSCDFWSDPAHPMSQRFKQRQDASSNP